MSETIKEEGLYRKASLAVDKWLEFHKGETFDLDMICKHLEIREPLKRHAIVQKLSYEVTTRKLEKSNRYYRYVDSTIVLRNDWVTIQSEPGLELSFPFSPDDDTGFGFDGCVDVPAKGLIILAGTTNTGKSAFCRNVLWANMHKRHCTYFSSETSPEDFADYASRMTWASPLNGDGKPVFDLADRFEHFKDVIRPDDINIIDWLNMGDAFYRIGEILQGIKSRLNKGIALIAIQKDPHKELGMGGMWSEHLSSLYITMDYGKLTVKKAKKWRSENPNGRTWSFEIVDRGTHFHGIKEIVKCHSCYGTGKYRGQECSSCDGEGWIDKAPLF